ncbi:hypothetical protein RJT34_06594 [Clitoria ternatea]|uniref:Uncharacterized protein n=1 Tax=Clitoria ternatea TaxID=43366 RepID=A0AAN9K2G1_CLITE
MYLSELLLLIIQRRKCSVEIHLCTYYVNTRLEQFDTETLEHMLGLVKEIPTLNSKVGAPSVTLATTQP